MNLSTPSYYYCIRKVIRLHLDLKMIIFVLLQVLCALSFLATGSYQRITGVTHHLTQRTASRCISQVVEALNSDYMGQSIDLRYHPQVASKIVDDEDRVPAHATASSRL